MTRRGISVLSAILLSFSFLAGCSDKPEAPGETQAVPDPIPTVQEAETAAETEAPMPDDGLPEVDYGGYGFRIAYYIGETVTVEEEKGEALNDAVFRRNTALEDRFGIRLEGTDFADYTAATDAVKASVTAGTYDYDLSFLHMVSAAAAASSGYFYSIDLLDAVDPSRPWWDTDCVDAFTVAGHMRLLCGLPLPNAMLVSACLTFNKRLFSDYGKELPYGLVDEGEWTLDALYEITKDVTHDLNGDGEIREKDDFFGLTCTFLHSPYAFYYGAGGSIVTKDGEGTPILNGDLESNTAIYEKIYRIVIDNRANYDAAIEHWTDAYEAFYEGRALFCEASLSNFGSEEFRELEDDYGVVPMPKFDAEQPRYQSFVNGAACMAAVPASLEDPERTGILMEGMAVESYRYIRDALFEVTVKARSSRDEESTRMMDLVMENRAFDLGYSHMFDQSRVQFVRDLLISRSTDVASAFAKSERMMQKTLERILAGYEKSR